MKINMKRSLGILVLAAIMPLSVFAKTEVKEAPLLLPKPDEMAIIHHNPDIMFITNTKWGIVGQVSDTVNKDGSKIEKVIYSAYDYTNKKDDYDSLVGIVYGDQDGVALLPSSALDKHKQQAKTELLTKNAPVPVKLITFGRNDALKAQHSLIKNSVVNEAISKSENLVGSTDTLNLYADMPINFGDFTEKASNDNMLLYGARDSQTNTEMLITAVPIPQLMMQAVEKNPHIVNTLTFRFSKQGLANIANLAKGIRSYTYMIDHYYTEIVVLKQVKLPSGVVSDSILMVSKNDLSPYFTYATYMTPDLNNGFATEEQVIRSMLSMHVEPKK